MRSVGDVCRFWQKTIIKSLYTQHSTARSLGDLCPSILTTGHYYQPIYTAQHSTLLLVSTPRLFPSLQLTYHLTRGHTDTITHSLSGILTLLRTRSQAYWQAYWHYYALAPRHTDTITHSLSGHTDSITHSLAGHTDTITHSLSGSPWSIRALWLWPENSNNLLLYC